MWGRWGESLEGLPLWVAVKGILEKRTGKSLWEAGVEGCGRGGLPCAEPSWREREGEHPGSKLLETFPVWCSEVGLWLGGSSILEGGEELSFHQPMQGFSNWDLRKTSFRRPQDL